jgi:uncharacterized protein
MHVVELVTYPVKGCARVSHSSVQVGPAGLAGDRTFMITDPDGVFRTQRTDPGLAVIRPGLDEQQLRLSLAAPGIGPITVEVDLDGPRRPVALFGNPYTGIDQGDDVAAWLSAAAGVPCRLVRVPPEHSRVTSGLTPGTAAFADGAAVHMAALGTLDELNGRMDGPPLPMTRFRPNVVLDGAAGVEDTFRRITIGGVELGYAKVTKRCVVTRVDQLTGVRGGLEPLRTLATYRRVRGGVAFGAHFSVTRGGRVTVGDSVDVLESDASELLSASSAAVPAP